jgi:uncharacterized membrane protein YccC
MAERVAGTVAGLVAGWALLRLFPQPLLQALFIVAAGVTFFTARTRRYALATGAITLLVLLCANQVGDGYGLIVPRLIDTLIGCGIAALAVFLVLPDWESRRITDAAARALDCHGRYLREIMAQYRGGKRDDLAYRLARRNAHNADAALSSTVSGMLREPGFLRRHGDTSVRFLVASHTLLSYLSGLGAHRQRLAAGDGADLGEHAGAHLAEALDGMARALARQQPPGPAPAGEAALLDELARQAGAPDAAQRLIATQLAHLVRQLAALRPLAAGLLPLEAIGPPRAAPA